MGLDQQKTEFSTGPLKTALSRYYFTRQKELILELLVPRAGERVLCIGDDVGDYLQIFRDKCCQLTGLVSSVEMLQTLRKKVGDGIDLYPGNAEDLPFSDDEFDVVFIVKALETAGYPQKIISEATRVCSGRVFIGFLNKYSFTGNRWKIKRNFGFSVAEKIRFFGIGEIKKMAAGVVDLQNVKWGSVIYFPAVIYDISAELEKLVPHMKNPFGAFMGISFPVKYIYRAAQNPLVGSYQLKADTGPAPDTIRGMSRKKNK